MRLQVVLGIVALAATAGAQTPPTPPPAPPAPRARAVQVQTAMAGSYLGIGVAEVTPDRAKTLNLKEVRGAEVTSVTADSPAAKAGLKENDVVLEYNGQPVQGVAELTRMVQETPADRQVKIVVWRNGGTQTLTATIGTRRGGSMTMIGPNGNWTMPDLGNLRINPPQIDIPQFRMTWQNPRLGIMGESLTEESQLADFFGVKDGVLVKSVTKNSAAEKAGIKAGDVIVKVGDSKVTNTEEITRALRSLRDAKNTVTVVVVRNKKETSINVTIEGQNANPVRASLDERRFQAMQEERMKAAQEKIEAAQERLKALQEQFNNNTLRELLERSSRIRTIAM